MFLNADPLHDSLIFSHTISRAIALPPVVFKQTISIKQIKQQMKENRLKKTN
jgi:hypothetical protein